MNSALKNKLARLGILSTCLLAIVAGGSILRQHRASPHMSQHPVYHDADTYIPQKIAQCTNDAHKTNCLKAAAEDFTARYQVAELLATFEKNENSKIFFESCHETLHFVGRFEYQKIGNISQALTAGNPVCFAGFYHGVLEAYLIDKHLTPGEADVGELRRQIPALCQKPASGIATKDYNECLHGLGHSLMFATDSNLPASLQLCDTLSGSSDQQWCYSGVFMENSTSSTNPDHPNQYLKKNDPLYPCDILEPKYLNMCYTLQSFYLAQISNFDWLKTFQWCQKVPRAYQDGCFNAIGQNQVGFTQDFSVMNKNCALAPTEQGHIACIQGAVGALHDRYNDGPRKMIEFCNTLKNDIAPACFDRAFSILKSLDQNGTNLKNLCPLIKNTDYIYQCLNKSIF